jgi:hypothetical protein
MSSRNRNLFSSLAVSTAALLGVLFVGSGSAGAAQRAYAGDVRARAALRAGSPQLVAVGPARLLHIDVLEGSSAKMYRMIGHDGQAPDCARTTGVEQRSPLHHDSNALNLDLPPGQVVCVEVDTVTDRGHTSVAWHVERGVQTSSPAAATMVATAR